MGTGGSPGLAYVTVMWLVILVANSKFRLSHAPCPMPLLPLCPANLQQFSPLFIPTLLLNNKRCVCGVCVVVGWQQNYNVSFQIFLYREPSGVSNKCCNIYSVLGFHSKNFKNWKPYELWSMRLTFELLMRSYWLLRATETQTETLAA